LVAEAKTTVDPTVHPDVAARVFVVVALAVAVKARNIADR